jgi:hypothetical protein
MPIHENLRVVAYMARHDPLVILGLCLIGAGTVLFFHILLRMNRAGLFTFASWRYDSGYKLPGVYLRVRKQRGWSPWPAFFIWPCFVLGFVALALGFSRLH